MRRASAIALDVVLLLLGGVVLYVIVLGGGLHTLGATRVSIRSVENPLLIAAILLVVRYSCRSWAGLFGLDRFPLDRVDARARHSLVSATQGLERRATPSTVAALMAIALAAKIAGAWLAPGFYSGDDVEIQEMTLGRLLDEPWPVWDLRNAFFPMIFIYPVQWLAHAAGQVNVERLVPIGRTVVAVCSTAAIWLLWRIGRDRFDNKAIAVAAAGLYAISKLHVAYGSTELPRPVATAVVLAAFWCLIARATVAGALWGGILLGVAAAFRFSEVLFVVAAVTQLLLARRAPAAFACAAGAAAAFIAVVGLADALFWGEPFASLKAAVDYTLVRRESSRGYQTVAWYLLAVPQWTNWVVFALALFGSRAAPRPFAIWCWIPFAILSVLPHQEPRYLIPLMPFFCVLAAHGLIRATRTVLSSAGGMPRWAPVALVVVAVFAVLLEAGGWHLARTNAEVGMARAMAHQYPDTGPVVVDQGWRFGGRLYLSRVGSVTDFEPGRAGEHDELARAVASAEWIVISARTRAAIDPALLQPDAFTLVAVEGGAPGYEVLRRVRTP